MDSQIIVLLAVLIVVVLGVGAVLVREHLARRGGDRPRRASHEATAELQGHQLAQASIAARAGRRERLDVVPLAPAAADRFVARWHEVQARFLDEPAAALAEAESLIARVMVQRGYPVATFEQRSRELSADHPIVVTEYLEATAIALASRRGEADSDDLRRAMVHYRRLFENLLDSHNHPQDRGRSAARG